jgi:hypothetical protein
MASEGALRRIVLALPEVHEDTHRGRPSFRVGRKIVVLLDGERPVAYVKFDREDQLNLVEAYPDILELPSWQRYGGTMLWYERADEALLTDLLRLVWLLVAPKRLARALAEPRE